MRNEFTSRMNLRIWLLQYRVITGELVSTADLFIYLFITKKGYLVINLKQKCLRKDFSRISLPTGDTSL